MERLSQNKIVSCCALKQTSMLQTKRPVAHTFDPSSLERGLSLSSRSVWSTEGVPGSSTQRNGFEKPKLQVNIYKKKIILILLELPSLFIPGQ